MASSLPLSENSSFRKIVIALPLLLYEIDFIWVVKKEITKIFGNVRSISISTYFSDPKRKT